MERKTPIWKKIIKAIFFVVFVVVFSFAATALAYYASGYKYNAKANKVQKTGMILVDYKEDAIKIVLDGKEVKYTKGRQGFWAPTNYIISTLPGKYSLEIIKDGKKNYSENILVEEEMITKVEDIILLPDPPKTKDLFEDNIQEYCISPDNKNIIYQSNNNTYLYNIDSSKETLLSQKIGSIVNAGCSWGPSNNKAVIKSQTEINTLFYIVNLYEPEKSFFLRDTLSFVPQLDSAYFSPFDENIIIGTTKNEIYKINLSARRVDILDENIEEFFLNNTAYYYKKGSANLYRINPVSYTQEMALENISRDRDFAIVFSSLDITYIRNNNTIYLISNKNNLEVVDKEVESIPETSGKDGFFYTKNFELWFYKISERKKYIVSRFSQAINKSEAFYNGHILHASNKELGVIRDNGENNQSIITVGHIDDFRILEKENILLITKESNGYEFNLIDLEIPE